MLQVRVDNDSGLWLDYCNSAIMTDANPTCILVNLILVAFSTNCEFYQTVCLAVRPRLNDNQVTGSIKGQAAGPLNAALSSQFHK